MTNQEKGEERENKEKEKVTVERFWVEQFDEIRQGKTRWLEL